MITVARLGPQDAERVLEVPHLFDDPPDREAIVAFLADSRNVLLFAFVESQPAGFLRAHELPQLQSTRRQMFLYEIGVDTPYRRRGAGRALVEELLRISRERDCEEVFVITNASNEPAMRLYQSTGGIREAGDDVVFVYSLPG